MERNEQMGKLKIEYVPTESLKTYANNAKIHTAEQIEQIKKSITEFSFNDPIAVWKDNEIIEGHGRLIAALELGIEELPIIRLDNLTDEQRKAYTLVHNKLTMNTGFDMELLDLEIEATDIDMEQFGFTDVSIDWNDVPDLDEKTYEEPNHTMLECPACHHIDRDIHFKKI
jgi:ParB-like chromosome segregation protein Spo0J